MTGLFGGTFDPPHVGHVALVKAAVRQLGLDDVLVLVVAEPGHRQVVCDVETRLELARAAFPGHRVEREEHARTIDSVRGRDHGDTVFLVGADEFAAFLTWKEPQELLEHVRLGVGTRPGYPRERLDDVLAHLEHPERVLFFELEPQAVSSSEIRARIARGEPIHDLVPPAVAALVASRRLYEHQVP